LVEYMTIIVCDLHWARASLVNSTFEPDHNSDPTVVSEPK